MDLDYMDEILQGIDQKLGASVPQCLLQPMLSSLTLANSPAVTVRSTSTPMRANERPPPPEDFGTPVTSDAAADGVIGADDKNPQQLNQDYGSVAGKLIAKRQGLKESFRKLKKDMGVLRAVDVGLMKNLLGIYDTCEEIRWMTENYDLSDSCESINSSVYESIEQIHEKWKTERRQWQSASSQNLSCWRPDDSRSDYYVGRLNSTGSRMQAVGEGYDFRGLKTTSCRSPQLNRSFPQFTSANNNFEMQRRASMDHLPIVSSPPVAGPSPLQSPAVTRKRRSSFGAVDTVVVTEPRIGTVDDPESTDEQLLVKKSKFLIHHNHSSDPSTPESQLVGVIDTADI